MQNKKLKYNYGEIYYYKNKFPNVYQFQLLKWNDRQQQTIKMYLNFY